MKLICLILFFHNIHAFLTYNLKCFMHNIILIGIGQAWNKNMNYLIVLSLFCTISKMLAFLMQVFQGLFKRVFAFFSSWYIGCKTSVDFDILFINITSHL